ncbi:pyruvate decarboxylase THI3 [Pholiota conissans]|uniref:Pyruvate decarboxylase THI3 n=1 Tax=Pholiota conissans TaxID=109636 RepID=A0A9P6CVX3_9AGAR|nr:pyruvate decarboxylase THI3 [Pholiota conissans]
MAEDREALSTELDRIRLQLQALQAKTGTQDITIGQYLLTRLAQLGVTSMFGLPGDFNLGFLDLVEDHPTVNWVGNCNELNAAYAADGYARIKEGTLGVITTTFGVGELSAINGIAGAYAEMVPVLHVVGVPSTTQFKTRPMLHHTLGDGRFDVYEVAVSPFVAYQAHIMKKSEAASEIDKAITECITKSRPVYLTLPTDMVYQTISSERLHIPLSPNFPPNDPSKEAFVIDQIYDRVTEAQGDVVVIVDACVIRHCSRKEVADFLKATSFPVYATPMGKTAVDENSKRYGGIYVGNLTDPEVKEKVESANLIISIGSLLSDFNSGNFSYNIPIRRHIELHSGHTQVQYAIYENIGMKQMLPKLTERLEHFHAIAKNLPVPAFVKQLPHQDTAVISHLWFWPRMGYFFRPKDVIVTETGTANFGILDVPLPEGSILVNQILWGSIGWSVGSCLGAALAARDVGMERVILFVGDGSLQLTVQELSPMIKSGLRPIIFVLNNRGYSIERYIHGKHRKYNDIADWKWTNLLDTLNDHSNYDVESYTVTNKMELSDLLDNSTFANAGKMQLVEVIMDALDAPDALQRQAELTGKGNAYSAK